MKYRNSKVKSFACDLEIVGENKGYKIKDRYTILSEVRSKAHQSKDMLPHLSLLVYMVPYQPIYKP